jgi:GNAT superfamily N-acetyltransferase
MAAEIASMRAQDEAAFLELTRAFYSHERFDFDPAASGRMVRHLLAHPEVGAVWLARQGGRAVGYLVLTRCYSLEFGGPFVLLDEIFVLPEARGAGLGRRLIDVAAQYCRGHGGRLPAARGAEGKRPLRRYLSRLRLPYGGPVSDEPGRY